MSIVQNLKLLNKPINELAMLPQETIIQMAQAGQIPTAFVAPILGEKAEQAKVGANAAAMMAQQEMPPTTVLEGIIAQNAANQAVESMPAMAPMGQQMPMEMPEDSGIAALPVSENMVPEFAGGGIVAFKAGDLVDGFDYNAATNAIDAASGVPNVNYGQFGNVGEEFQRINELRRQILGDNVAAQDELKNMEAAAQQQRAMRLLEAGLGIMGGESPYALSNISKGATPALRGYAEDVAAQRKRKTELMGLERAEKSKLLDSVLDKQTRVEAANIAAGKGTDMSRYVDNFVTAARAEGSKVDEAVLRKMGNDEYLSRFAAAGTRAQAAVTQADVAGAKVVESAETAARAAVDKVTGPGGTNSSEYNRLARADRKANKESGAKPGDPNYQNSADEYKERLVQQRLRTPSATPAAKPAATSAGAKPTIQSVKGAPAGATIGNLVEGKGYQVLDRNGKVIGYAR